MTSPSLAQRVIALLLSVTLLGMSGGMAWAAAADFAGKDAIAYGVRVGSVEVGGMDVDSATQAIEQSVSAPLLAPVSVEVDGERFVFDARQAVSVDTQRMVADAVAARGRVPITERLAHDLLGRELVVDVAPRYSIDANAVKQWLAGVREKIDRKPADATIAVEDGAIVVTPAVVGRNLQMEESEKIITKALTSGGTQRTASLVVKKKKPKVTEKRFRKAIVVDLSKRRIRLYNNGDLEKTYRCAVGTPGFPTPQGEFEVTAKRYRPTWVNPGSDWAKEMPPYIPPGPANPLGTRAINLSAPAIRFHGTNNIRSVGTAASHGCMRMVRADVEDLYERVYLGMKVFIVP